MAEENQVEQTTETKEQAPQVQETPHRHSHKTRLIILLKDD